MTQTKEHHAHPACSDTRWAITSQLGLCLSRHFISKRLPGLCTRCQTKSAPITAGTATETPHPSSSLLPSRHKGRLRGEVMGMGRRETLAMLEQTHLKWGLGYYTCQGFFFFLPLCLIMLANCWWPQAWRALNRDQQIPEAKGPGGSLCKGKHLTRHILWVLLFEGYASLTNPVALRLQAADILTKTNPGYYLYIQMISGKSC